MRNLMILRHGKSDWDSSALDDHSRPLASRGVRSARAVGRAIADYGISPEVVVSSTATRARSTAELVIEAGGLDASLHLEDRLYGASVNETLTVVAEYGKSANRVLIVGHQPTWSMTIRHLTGGTVAVRTATLADVELPIDTWDAVPRASGTLVALLQPRMLLTKEDNG